MPASRTTPQAGVAAPFGGATPAAVFDPEALEQRRFDRDRSQAMMVLVALVVPLAAFAVNDALLSSN